jgi:hypothetical protein
MTRRSLPGRILRIALFTAIALVTLLALAASWFSFAGRNHWARVKAHLLARGEKLSLAELAPPPIPAQENFFADPLWREVTDRLPDDTPRVPFEKQQLRAIGKAEISPDLSKRIMATVREIREPQLQFLLSRLEREASEDDPAVIKAGILVTAASRDHDTGRRRQLAQFALEALEPASGLLRYLAPLLESTRARASIDYEKGVQAPMEHISVLLYLGRAYSDRARAELFLGSPDAASKDVLSALRLAGTLETEITLISHLVRLAMLMQTAKAIDQGIALHSWTDDDLQVFEQALSRIPVLRKLPTTLRGERAGFNTVFERLQAGGEPRNNLFDLVAGLSNQLDSVGGKPLPLPARYLYLAVFKAGDQAATNESYQSLIDATSAEPIDIDTLPRPQEALATAPLARLRYPFTLLTIPATAGQPLQRFVQSEDHLRLTRIACALERYRLRHQQYPDKLDTLVPEFLAAIPRDVIAGQSFHYRRDGASFRLWSNGWDRKDDGGDFHSDPRKARDWSWNSR